MAIRDFNVREPVSAYSHLIGSVLVILGYLLLLPRLVDDWVLFLVITLYSLASFATFTASTIMHAYTGSKKIIQRLIRIDHAMIYFMIAGTYTPFAYAFLDDGWRWSILITVWTMAIAGIIYKLTRWKKDSLLSTVYYVLMGWTILPAIPSALPNIPIGAVIWLFIGGACYTLGAVVFMSNRPTINEHIGSHEIWHFFTLAGFILPLYCGCNICCSIT